MKETKNKKFGDHKKKKNSGNDALRTININYTLSLENIVPKEVRVPSTDRKKFKNKKKRFKMYKITIII